MKEWLTAREIASQALPGLPGTERAIQLYAAREGWNEHPSLARQRAGRGGGLEYHYRILPTLAQVAYCQRHLRIGSPDMPAAANDDPTEPGTANVATGQAAIERDARLAIVAQFERFRSGLVLRQNAALQVFTDKYNSRTLHIDEWILTVVPHLSKGSLRRWMTKKRKGASLAIDRSKARKGKGALDVAEGGKVRNTILALLADNQHFSAEHIRDLIEAEYGATLTVPAKGVAKRVPLPPTRTFQHYLKALRTSEQVVLARIQNPDRFRSTMVARGRNSLSHIHEANALWQIDASPTDALCTDGRHAVYVCLDIATRRMTTFVSRTPRASAVALLIRKAILAWGVPDLIKTDNGSDFVARDTKRLFAHLEIEVELSDPYQPQQKAFVERAIGTLQRDCVATLPGFVGHSVADRKAIEDRKSFAARLGESDAEAFGIALTGEELQAALDRWVGTYEHREHDGLKGETPYMVAARSTRPVRHVDERALDVLLMTVPQGGTRRVTASGIRVDGNHYMTPTILPGTEVLVRMDSADLGVVYAFAPGGEEFLGVGICPALSGIAPEAAAKAIKDMNNEISARGAAAVKAEIRRLKKGGAYHERILAVRESRIPNVVALPKKREEHTTPQIAAALEAMSASSSASTDDGPTPEQLALMAEMEMADADARLRASLAAHEEQRSAERLAGLPENVTRLPEGPEDRYRRAVQVATAIEAGTADPKDVYWLSRYEQTAEFKAHRALHEEHGDVFLGR